MKKFFAVLLSLVLLAGCFCISPANRHAEALNQSAYDAMLQALLDVRDSVDLKQYNLTVDSTGKSEGFSDIINALLDEHPELFYSSMNFGYGYTTCVTTVNLAGSYTMDKSDIPAAKDWVNGAIDSIIASIPRFSMLSELEKAMALHDYIAVNYNYDDSLTKHDVYSLLTTGEGVCQAFTGLYTLLLRRASIEVGVSQSDSLVHIWNVVKLDGKWYHVDTTWDDTDFTGRAYHKYFLVDDASWQVEDDFRNAHTDFYDNVTCDSTVYNNALWVEHDVISPFVFTNIGCYCIIADESGKGGAVCHVDLNAGTFEPIVEIDRPWMVYGTTSYYPGCYSGLCANGIYLYYNDYMNVYRYDTELGTTETVHTIADSEARIYGITGGLVENVYNIIFETSANPNDSGTVYRVTDTVGCVDGHNFTMSSVKTAPTAEAAGTAEFTCTCGAKKDVTIPALSVSNGYSYSVKTPATTESAGTAEWTHPSFGTFTTSIPKLEVPETLTAEEVLGDSYVYADGFVRGFAAGTQVASITGDNLKVYKANGTTEVTGGALASGMIIKITVGGNVTDTVTVVVSGDATGDGTINTLDFIAVRLHILGINTLTGATGKAADVNNNTNVDTLDFIAVRLHILGIRTIAG